MRLPNSQHYVFTYFLFSNLTALRSVSSASLPRISTLPSRTLICYSSFSIWISVYAASSSVVCNLFCVSFVLTSIATTLFFATPSHSLLSFNTVQDSSDAVFQFAILHQLRADYAPNTFFSPTIQLSRHIFETKLQLNNFCTHTTYLFSQTKTELASERRLFLLCYLQLALHMQVIHRNSLLIYYQSQLV